MQIKCPAIGPPPGAIVRHVVQPNLLDWMTEEDIREPKFWDFAQWADIAYIDMFSKLDALTGMCEHKITTTNTNMDLIITEHIIHHQACNLIAPEILRYLIDTSVA
eukprot:4004532-Karenia_brevis.AAC.1